MTEIKFDMAKVYEHSKRMPADYVRDLLHHGKLSEDRKTIKFDHPSYKKLLKKYHPRVHGAGRLVATMTAVTGVAVVSKGLTKKDCGCKAREERLNRIGKKLTQAVGA